MKVPRSVLSLGMGLSAMAQNLSYGADNFYRSSNVTIQPITFQTKCQATVAGNLFYLKNHNNNSAPAAGIVVGHPMGAVKEQSANLYATKLAEQGFITVSIDIPFWGGSEAFSAAVDYLGVQNLTSVNSDSIGGVDSCGSGGFLISAAKLDPRLKAIATVSMYEMGSVARQGLNDSQSLDQLKEILAAAAQQRWTEIDGGETRYTSGTLNELTANATAVEREFYEYYRTVRGEFTPINSTPELTTHLTLSTFTKFVKFYSSSGIETISPRPMLFVAGDQAHSREFSEDAYSRADEPKDLFWISGAGHVDLYDRTELIPFPRLVAFCRSNLV